ncbi:5060_t:CDS:2, partial [Funneliformis mosseae]
PAKEIEKLINEIKGEVRKKITDAFPGGLPYVKPEPLLYTSGSNWEYQPDPSLKQILRRELKNHYENFILGRFDKLNLPIYLFLSGAGTGKSRNANEFHQTAITCLPAQEDEELLTRIKEAWVFL